MEVLSGIKDYAKESAGYPPDVIQSDGFMFEATVPAAGTGLTQPGTVRVPAGYIFALRKVVGYWQRFPGVANDIQAIPLIQVQVRESGGKRNVFDQSLSFAALVGSDASHKELELPTYYSFAAGADITVTFTVTNAAAYAAIGMGAAKLVGIVLVGDLVAATKAER